MEKRVSERMAARLMVEFFLTAGPESALDDKTTGMTRDLSAEGLFVRTTRLPPIGGNLCLLLHLPDGEPVVLTGEIVRTLEAAEARAADLSPGFAVRLVYHPLEFSAFLSVSKSPNDGHDCVRDG